MAVLVYLVLFLALTGHSIPLADAAYCLCKDGLGDATLQKTIDYACGSGADCTPILQNGACYNPNTIKDHCNYAANSYYQRKSTSGATCDFSGTASLSNTPPTNVATTCVYASNASTTGTTPTATPTTGTGTGTTAPSTTTGTTTGTGTSPSVFGTGLGPTATTSINDSGAVMASTNLFFATLPLWFSSLILLWV